MKNIAAWVLSALLLMGMLTVPSVADDKGVEDLMKAHIEALGGEEALGKIKTISRSGVMYIEGDFGEFEGDYSESTIVGNTDDADIHLLQVLLQRRAHESG